MSTKAVRGQKHTFLPCNDVTLLSGVNGMDIVLPALPIVAAAVGAATGLRPEGMSMLESLVILEPPKLAADNVLAMLARLLSVLTVLTALCAGAVLGKITCTACIAGIPLASCSCEAPVGTHAVPA